MHIPILKKHFQVASVIHISWIKNSLVRKQIVVQKLLYAGRQQPSFQCTCVISLTITRPHVRYTEKGRKDYETTLKSKNTNSTIINPGSHRKSMLWLQAKHCIDNKPGQAEELWPKCVPTYNSKLMPTNLQRKSHKLHWDGQLQQGVMLATSSHISLIRSIKNYAKETGSVLRDAVLQKPVDMTLHRHSTKGQLEPGSKINSQSQKKMFLKLDKAK